MGLDSGSVTFRVFEIEGGFDEEILKRFEGDAIPPIETLHREPITGWGGPRHLLDRDLTPENCLAGNYLRVTLMKAERKIPPSLLRAHCRLAEAEQMKARDVLHLNRATRREIKEEVVDRLLPTMPPTLTGMPALFDLIQKNAYVQALSLRQVDAFVLAVRKATGLSIIPCTPEVAAMKLKAVNVRDLDPVCFSPDPEAAPASEGIGLEFLTWLWYFAEIGQEEAMGHAGTGPKDFVWMVEGPLTFIVEGAGAHEAVLRRGMPLCSAEAKTALLSGKKLRRANLLLARGEEQWSVALDAVDFAFRGLKLPKPELADPTSALQERIHQLLVFQTAFFRLYERFLDLRRAPANWERTVQAMQDWVSSRTSRA